MSANEARGEVSLKLRDAEYTVRPTFSALCAVEAEIGSIFRLVDRAAEGDLNLKDLTALLWHCVDRAQVSDRTAFSEAVLAGGLMQAAPIARHILRQALEGF